MLLFRSSFFRQGSRIAASLVLCSLSLDPADQTSRLLLIDTANPAKATEGVNDLKTMVRYLLGHESDGQTRAHPLDFVVSITHNHPDHMRAFSPIRTAPFITPTWTGRRKRLRTMSPYAKAAVPPTTVTARR